MAVKAEIVRSGYAHFAGKLGLVFTMTGDAVAGIDFRQSIGVARVSELAARMVILSGFKRIAMAVHAGILQNLLTTERGGVAAGAGQLDLMVAMAGLPEQKYLVVI
jgi:hypothetical protein